MSMKTSGIFYEHSSYTPEKVAARYIAFRAGDLILFEVNDSNMTIRETYADPKNFDLAKVAKAESLKGHWPNQVQL
jgi:hypothetical protein